MHSIYLTSHEEYEWINNYIRETIRAYCPNNICIVFLWLNHDWWCKVVKKLFLELISSHNILKKENFFWITWWLISSIEGEVTVYMYANSKLLAPTLLIKFTLVHEPLRLSNVHLISAPDQSRKKWMHHYKTEARSLLS